MAVSNGRSESVARFVHIQPSRDAFWRAIILFGRNSASYKFAFGQALLDAAAQGKQRVTLLDLARPFAQSVCQHIKEAERQGISSQSKFLDACRAHIRGEIDLDQLVEITAKRGFVNVVDAFHVVNDSPVSLRFYDDNRRSGGEIVLTDELLALASSGERGNLAAETEARWRLVETAWNTGLSPGMLAVQFDPELESFFLQPRDRARREVTSSRSALNGYQKGKCFYCFRSISVDAGQPEVADVDHFYPVMLQTRFDVAVNLNGVWNLILSCRRCNRGEGGKFGRLPALRYLERLSTRNGYLIDSHHPLRETLMNQTGGTAQERHDFLQRIDREAVAALVPTESARWLPPDELPAAF